MPGDFTGADPRHGTATASPWARLPLSEPFFLFIFLFFFYALKLFDYLDAFLWSFPGLKRTYVISEANRILEYDYEKVRLLVVNSLS